jgi:transposase-like protein
MEQLLTALVHMVLEPICCPNCNSTNVVKNGKSDEGKQRYRCRNVECSRRSFIRDYSYRGYLPAVKQQISDMAVNGSGIRDTARVLKISPTTVIEELKKRSLSGTNQHATAATEANFAYYSNGRAS